MRVLERLFNRDRLWRWRRWIVALSVLLLLRAVLPEIVRRIIVTQAEQHLRARVDVGGVDLALYRAGVALTDVAVRPLAPAPDAPPLLAWKRLDIELRWLPLFHETIRLQHVLLDSPRVAIDRLADGQLNVLALLPPPATPPASTTPVATPAAAAGKGWGFGLDRVVLSNGGLRFHDLTFKDSEPIELNLEHVEVNDIALDQAVYGAPSRLHLALAVDQGALDLDAYLTLRDDGTAVDANLNAWGLPLQQARLYIPSVGWSAFDGALDAALAYHLETGRHHEISGTVALRDLAVHVPGLDTPALAWRNLTLRLNPLDLIGQRVAISDVELSGASLLVRLHGGVLLPLLAESLHAGAAEAAAATPGETPAAVTPTAASGDATSAVEPPSPSPTAEPTATASPTTEIPPTATPTATAETTAGAPASTVGSAAQPTPEATPWTWSVAAAKIDDCTVHLLGREAPLDIGIGLTASDLAGDADYPAHVGLALMVGDGTVKLDGALRLHSPGFAGTLQVANLSIPPLLVSATTLPTDLLSSGRLSTELTLEAGMAVPDGGTLGPRDARVRGRVTLADAQLKTPATPPLSIATRALDLELKDLHVAGALPGDVAGGVPEAGGLAAGDVHVDGTLSLTEPSIAAPDSNGMSAGAGSVALTLADVTVAAALPPAPGAPTRGDLRGGIHLALAAAHAAPAGSQGVAVEAQSLDLGITDLTAQGLLASAPAPAGDVRIGDGRLSLAQVKLTGADPKTLLVGTQSTALTLSQVTVGGVIPAPGATARGDVQAGVHLAVADLHVAAEQQGVSLDTQSIDLGITDVSALGLLAPAESAGRDLHLRGERLSLAQLKLGFPGAALDAQSLDLGIADLSAAGLLVPAADIQLHDGRLSLAQFNLAGADSKVFLVGTRSFELPVNEITLPGRAERPLHVAVGDVRLVHPTVQVTRTSDGLVLPQFTSASSAQPAASVPPGPSPSPAAPARPMDVVLSSFRLTDGQVSALDRSVKPFFKGGLDPLDIDVRGVRWPALSVDKIQVTATGPEKGKLEMYGALKADDGWFEMYADKLALSPYNPYATSFSSYSIGGGTLSVATKGSRKADRYYASTAVTLHDLNLQGGAGESLFAQQFGVPLEMALALMRDLNGDITLDIPIEADSQGTKVDVLSVVGGALRRAIVNALTSPLKLVGAVFSGKEGGIAAPAPIGFRPGRAELDPAGSQQVDQLAAFLAGRPGIGATLETSVTNTDVRWLREQALLQAWDNAGVLGTLRGLTQRSARDRVRQALEARRKDQSAELSAEDTAALDGWLDEQPPIPAEQLLSLASARLAQTEAALEEGHGLDATRVKRRAPVADATDGAPAVQVGLGAAGR